MESPFSGWHVAPLTIEECPTLAVVSRGSQPPGTPVRGLEDLFRAISAVKTPEWTEEDWKMAAEVESMIISALIDPCNPPFAVYSADNQFLASILATQPEQTLQNLVNDVLTCLPPRSRDNGLADALNLISSQDPARRTNPVDCMSSMTVVNGEGGLVPGPGSPGYAPRAIRVFGFIYAPCIVENDDYMLECQRLLLHALSKKASALKVELTPALASESLALLTGFHLPTSCMGPSSMTISARYSHARTSSLASTLDGEFVENEMPLTSVE